MSFKVCVGELCFREIRCRNISVEVMVFSSCNSELIKIDVFDLEEKRRKKPQAGIQ